MCLVGCNFSTPVSMSDEPQDDGGGKDASVDALDDGSIAMPDGPPLAACPNPPAGCTRMTAACLPMTSCYYQCTTNRNREDARVRCEQDGLGCLVTINDAAENSCLATTLDPNNAANRYWIGFVQTNNTVEPAGGWTWTCPSSTFTPSPPWGLPPPANEPNDTNGNEDCAFVINNNGHWIDAACSDQLDYVCEFPR
jgi:hypothetical protein